MLPRLNYTPNHKPSQRCSRTCWRRCWPVLNKQQVHISTRLHQHAATNASIEQRAAAPVGAVVGHVHNQQQANSATAPLQQAAQKALIYSMNSSTSFHAAAAAHLLHCCAHHPTHLLAPSLATYSMNSRSTSASTDCSRHISISALGVAGRQPLRSVTCAAAARQLSASALLLNALLLLRLMLVPCNLSLLLTCTLDVAAAQTSSLLAAA